MGRKIAASGLWCQKKSRNQLVALPYQAAWARKEHSSPYPQDQKSYSSLVVSITREVSPTMLGSTCPGKSRGACWTQTVAPQGDCIIRFSLWCIPAETRLLSCLEVKTSSVQCWITCGSSFLSLHTCIQSDGKQSPMWGLSKSATAMGMQWYLQNEGR